MSKSHVRRLDLHIQSHEEATLEVQVKISRLSLMFDSYLLGKLPSLDSKHQIDVFPLLSLNPTSVIQPGLHCVIRGGRSLLMLFALLASANASFSTTILHCHYQLKVYDHSLRAP